LFIKDFLKVPTKKREEPKIKINFLRKKMVPSEGLEPPRR
jgi:hypothetical protein